MPAPVRLGVIGLGNIARQHIETLRTAEAPGCELAALCARGANATGESLAAELGVPYFDSHSALLASGCCDAVLVATPTNSHLPIGADALRAGLHVLMEKPLGLSLAEGEALLALQGKQQVFALMLNQRADPLFRAMREVIAAGTLGEITRTHWTMTHWFRPEIYFQVSDWRATWRGEGGGLLLNQCIHNLDIFQWLCGMPNAVRAFCRFGRYHNIEVEDEATAYFEYSNGATGVFIGSTGEAPGVNRFDIVGDRGSLAFDGARLTLTTLVPGAREFSQSTREMFGMPAAATRDITPVRDGNQHAAVLANFAAAIQDGAELIAPAAEGLHSLALANAMLLSTWENCRVALPLDSAHYQRALDARLATSRQRAKSQVTANIDMQASYR